MLVLNQTKFIVVVARRQVEEDSDWPHSEIVKEISGGVMSSGGDGVGVGVGVEIGTLGVWL